MRDARILSWKNEFLKDTAVLGQLSILLIQLDLEFKRAIVNADL